MSTVVIIGRKNVGKSTLFNRLTGIRQSVVYKEPGVTRDRVYGEVQWCGRAFDLIDTGGFYPDEQNVLENKINQQIIIGIEESDLVYFVVDGKTGLHPVDEDIAEQLRKTSKPIFLLVNKSDSKEAIHVIGEFARLGFKNMHTISAEHGSGVGDFLDETLRLLPTTLIEKTNCSTRVTILGRPNAGKSTLLNCITESERAIVDDEPGTTRDSISARVQHKNEMLEIVDTCGLRKRTRISDSIEFYSTVRAIAAIDQCDIALLVFDTSQGIVDQDRRIAGMVISKTKALIVVPAKSDLIKKSQVKKIIPATSQSLKSFDFVPIVPVSAHAGTNIKTLLDTVIAVKHERTKRISHKTIQSIIKNFQPPSDGALLTLKQIGTQPPLFLATVTVSVKAHYIKYLRNTLRHYFGFVGVPILIKTRIIKRRTPLHAKRN